MRLFPCQHCGQVLNFENVRCGRCGHCLGYLPLPDLYPFILSAEVVGKLGFVHEVVRAHGADDASLSA